MKTLLIFLALATSAFASPFLVCDPYPANTDSTQVVSSFVITGLGINPVTTAAQINPDGSQELHFDLSALTNGSYTITVSAVNQWGTGAASAPFTFTKAIVGAPGHVKISTN